MGTCIQAQASRLFGTGRLKVPALWSHPFLRIAVQKASTVGRKGRLMPMASGLEAFPVSSLPLSILSDSYKASHFLGYPPCVEMVAVSLQHLAFRVQNCQEKGQNVFGENLLLLARAYARLSPCSTGSSGRVLIKTLQTRASYSMA